jgi:Sec7-like guanine-nucleotide exchange factor
MLNTALHNPNAKMKITADMFVKQNKGINSGKDLPADMLEAIFRSASCIFKGTLSRVTSSVEDRGC